MARKTPPKAHAWDQAIISKAASSGSSKDGFASFSKYQK
jgi:hypothetical protein